MTDSIDLIVIVGLCCIPIARNAVYDLRNIGYCVEGLRNVYTTVTSSPKEPAASLGGCQGGHWLTPELGQTLSDWMLSLYVMCRQERTSSLTTEVMHTLTLLARVSGFGSYQPPSQRIIWLMPTSVSQIHAGKFHPTSRHPVMPVSF